MLMRKSHEAYHMLIYGRLKLPESHQALHRIGRIYLAKATLAILAACAPATSPLPVVSEQPLPEQSARFAERPDEIFAALQDACTARNQRLTSPARDVLECRMLLPPDPTASAILRYGGTIERLPELVIRLRLQPEVTGFTLAAAQYLEVPQQSGGDLRIVYPDATLDRRLRAILTDLGGDVDG